MPQDFRERLIVFTRYPEPGTTKTRMIPKLGARGAAELQRQMTEHLVSRLSDLKELPPEAVEVRYEGGSEKLMKDWLGPAFSYCPQGEGDIGFRMAHALVVAFEKEVETVLIIGSDVPDITAELIKRAFDSL
jgi:glycosyltransferase A (GT-A) superfamily protein (DUF2064 family)